MSISTETIATVKIADTGVLAEAAYHKAISELEDEFPLLVPVYRDENYDGGQYVFNFNLITPYAA